MTPTEKHALLAEWQAQIEAADKLIEPVSRALGLAVESPIHAAVWGLQEAYTKAVAQLVGDVDKWLNWYRRENDFGRRSLSAKPVMAPDMRPIYDLKDLLWLLGAT